MRKKIRKLALTRETLRTLEDPMLENAAGGVATTVTGGDTCPVVSCTSDVTRRCSVCCVP